MRWKAIGQSIKGTSHEQVNKCCEDALRFDLVMTPLDEEVLICCASDGAGSAKFAQAASSFTVETIVLLLSSCVKEGKIIDETRVRFILETVYDGLSEQANSNDVSKNEYSATCLGAVLFSDKAVFFQIGDGVMTREDSSGYYSAVFWPDNGEYLNDTRFLIDDINFPFLRFKLIEECINELSIVTDGLQGLILNQQAQSIHQPFYKDLFKWLRLASDRAHLQILDKKLTEFLNSWSVNQRTDDDKTLLLATRLQDASHAI
ncbi:PP2C family serine/threonine-protein phosphatase [Filimonas effusa]|uniref:Protein phosphatase 2C domain-containing protein n=1 Tax=Filimonas effusa TaxID=2508721 RepID=A0A4V1MAW5_9BACT|nr:PP2C family serine/threonine-protein phosphatase [Filimonas effusa]RXK87296.1 protein phosphatase 2C domain-containing protein [Filimonas effusa]